MTPAETFVRDHSVPIRPAPVAELELRLADQPIGIWQAAREAGFGHPFWAFAWPGGQALARYLLDHPELVRGRTVLDLGCGSGIAALAARHAGARHVVAADIDPLAVAATRANARLCDLDIDVTGDDILAGEGPVRAYDVVVIGDVAYESALARRVMPFTAKHRTAGATVLFGDRTRTPVPAHFEVLERYQMETAPPMHDDAPEPATVWQA